VEFYHNGTSIELYPLLVFEFSFFLLIIEDKRN